VSRIFYFFGLIEYGPLVPKLLIERYFRRSFRAHTALRRCPNFNRGNSAAQCARILQYVAVLCFLPFRVDYRGRFATQLLPRTSVPMIPSGGKIWSTNLTPECPKRLCRHGASILPLSKRHKFCIDNFYALIAACLLQIKFH